MESGKPIFTAIEGTLADGLAVPMIGYNAWETSKNLIDKMVCEKIHLKNPIQKTTQIKTVLS